MATEQSGSRNGPMDRIRHEARGLVGALGDRALSSVRDRVEGASSRLSEYAEGGGGPGVMAALTGARGVAEGKSPARSMLGAGLSGMREKVAGLFRRGGKGGGSRKLKLTNIVESIDVGVPVKVAYNQWTQYSDFPKFTKKVENVDRNKNEENKTNWKAQIFWSHRTWEATVIDQIPDQRIIWRSKGQKGHVDGAVTFHELAPNLTRILLDLEYHPQGMFERTGNLWRVQGRRARLEFKHFRRHMMTEGILHSDDLEGWRGTIRDGEVVESHEDAVEREDREGSDRDQQSSGRDRGQQSSGQRGSARDSGQQGRRTGSGEGSRRRSAERETTGGRTERSEPDGGTGDEQGDEPANGRSRTPARSRRASVSSTGGGANGNGRRQRAGAGTQRGGSNR